MKASELIKQLSELMAIHGDLVVKDISRYEVDSISIANDDVSNNAYFKLD